MWTPPKNDYGYSVERLERILGRRRLQFNPYSVTDCCLLEIAGATGWGNEWDITEIVTIYFTRLSETNDWRNFNGIFMQVGTSSQEVFINKGTLIYGITANGTIRKERLLMGRKPIRNEKDIEYLVGKRFFVSRVVRGSNIFGNGKVAYRMHRLTGNTQKDATTIRTGMCMAKIEMLERILAYPESPDYLSCNRNLFDFESPIRQMIDNIRRFPQTPVPPSPVP